MKLLQLSKAASKRAVHILSTLKYNKLSNML